MEITPGEREINRAARRSILNNPVARQLHIRRNKRLRDLLSKRRCDRRMRRVSKQS